MRSFKEYLSEAQDEFGKHVKRVMSSDAAYDILDSHPDTSGSTWNAGGCGVLAHAIHKHLTGSKLVDVFNKRTGNTEHMAVHLGDKIYDARGASHAKGFAKRFAKNELIQPEDLEVRDHDPSLTKKSEISTDAGLISKTHELLA